MKELLSKKEQILSDVTLIKKNKVQFRKAVAELRYSVFYPISIADIASHFGVSRTYIYELIKNEKFKARNTKNSNKRQSGVIYR